jgi:ATP-dependent Clp protease ATP-binding subunit ClpC
MKENLLDKLKKRFKPEFLNRIDDQVVFRSLTREQIRQIVDLNLISVSKQLVEKGITLRVTDTVKDFLGNKGYNEEYGARPLRRVIQNLIEDRLSEDILRSKFRTGDTVIVDLEGEEIVVHTAEPVGALSAESK